MKSLPFIVAIFACLNLFAMEGKQSERIINQSYGDTVYESSELYDCDLSNIKHHLGDRDIDGAGALIVYTAADTNKHFVLTAKRMNSDSKLNEYEIAIGGGLGKFTDFSVPNCLNSLVQFKTSSVVKVSSEEIEQKISTLFGKGSDWSMNRVSFIVRKPVKNLDELRAITKDINHQNAKQSDFRKDIQFDIIELSDIMASAKLTYDKHDKSHERAQAVHSNTVINHLTNEPIEQFIVFDDRLAEIVRRSYSF